MWRKYSSLKSNVEIAERWRPRPTNVDSYCIRRLFRRQAKSRNNLVVVVAAAAAGSFVV